MPRLDTTSDPNPAYVPGCNKAVQRRLLIKDERWDLFLEDIFWERFRELALELNITQGALLRRAMNSYDGYNRSAAVRCYLMAYSLGRVIT